MTIPFLLEIFKNRSEFPIGFIQVFGNNLCLGQRGHEIGISHPSRDDVEVKMVFPWASRLPDVESNIEPMGGEAGFKHLR